MDSLTRRRGALAEELHLRIIPVPGHERDREQGDVWQKIAMLGENHRTGGPVSVVGEDLLSLIVEKIIKISFHNLPHMMFRNVRLDCRDARLGANAHRRINDLKFASGRAGLADGLVLHVGPRPIKTRDGLVDTDAVLARRLPPGRQLCGQLIVCLPAAVASGTSFRRPVRTS
jgi:hypothetical protein